MPNDGSSAQPPTHLLTPDDIDRDVVAIDQAILEERAERIARNVLLRSDVQEAISQLLDTDLYSSEEDIIARSVKAMQVAVVPAA